MKITFSRVILMITGLIFLGFGTSYLLLPVSMSSAAGVELPMASAITDIRAVYGGLQLGLGLLLLFCAWQSVANPTLSVFGLLTILATLGGITVARAIGIFWDGSTDTHTLAVLAFETTGPLCALVALGRDGYLFGKSLPVNPNVTISS